MMFHFFTDHFCCFLLNYLHVYVYVIRNYIISQYFPWDVTQFHVWNHESHCLMPVDKESLSINFCWNILPHNMFSSCLQSLLVSPPYSLPFILRLPPKWSQTINHRIFAPKLKKKEDLFWFSRERGTCGQFQRCNCLHQMAKARRKSQENLGWHSPLGQLGATEIVIGVTHFLVQCARDLFFS